MHAQIVTFTPFTHLSSSNMTLNLIKRGQNCPIHPFLSRRPKGHALNEKNKIEKKRKNIVIQCFQVFLFPDFKKDLHGIMIIIHFCEA
jgi:hypothetical protein